MLAGWQVLRICLSLLPQCWDYKRTPDMAFSHRFWGLNLGLHPCAAAIPILSYLHNPLVLFSTSCGTLRQLFKQSVFYFPASKWGQ